MSEPDYAAILAPLREVIDRLRDRAEIAEAKLAAVEALAAGLEKRAAELAPDDDWGESIGDTIAADNFRAIAKRIREALRCEP